MQYAGLAMLAAILITMGLDSNLDVSWLYGVPWVALISLVYFVRRGLRTASIR
jgi:L-asparagine transporter-like permease